MKNCEHIPELSDWIILRKLGWSEQKQWFIEIVWEELFGSYNKVISLYAPW